MMRKILSWPVRVHLLLLVILLALPSIALILHWGVAARDQAVEDAKSECLKFVNAIAGEQQAAVAGVQQLLATLALLPEVKSRNGPAANALLADLLKKNPIYANIIISDKFGLVWAAGTPFEGPFSIAGRKYFEDAVRSGTYSSGEFSVGRIGKRPVITFAQPVTDASNELTSVIAVSLNLDHVQSLFEKINLPEGSSFSLLDHRGIILHRNSRDAFSEQLVGKPDIREDLFTKMVEGPDEGTYEAVGNDGKVRLTAYRKLRLSQEAKPYLYVRSSIPEASVVSKANAAMLRNTAALASVFAVGLILAVLLGKRMIVDPITKLKEASRQLAAGPAAVNVSGHVKGGELGELAHAFDDMAEALLRKEKELLESERRERERAEELATMLEAVPTPVIIVHDPDSTHMTGNLAADELLRHPRGAEASLSAPDEVKPRHFRAMKDGRELRVDELPAQRAARGEHVKDFEFSLVFDDGAFRHLLGYGTPLLDKQGSARGAVHVLVDITERKRAEEELQKLASVVRHSSEMINVATLDGQMIFINDAGAEMVGLSPEEVLRTHILQVIPDHLQDKVNHEVLPTLKEKGSWNGELQYRNLKTGRLTDVYATTFTVKDPDRGTPLFLANTSIDITERKRAEEALRKSEEKFIKTFQSNPAGIGLSRLSDGLVIEANEVMLKVLGYGSDEFIGRKIPDLGVWANPADRERLLQALGTEGRSMNQEYWLRTKTGELRLCNHSAELIQIGDVPHVIFTFFDITERKRAEEKLRLSEEALQLANESLEKRVRERTMDLQNLTEQLERSRHELRKLASELVMSEERERKRIAGVLHDDIAQTLAAARMRLDLLQSMQSDQKDKQTLQEVKAFLVQSIQETRALMTDIGNPLLFDLGLKAACEALANRLMERHPVRIRCDIPDAYKHLDPDVKAILYQLIRELLNNVAKHSRAQNARVMISMEDGHFRVQVTDDGVGFDPQALGAPTAEGGFGLFSIRERLIAIDGSLRIESAPGAGTVVTAILPSTFD